MIIVKRTAPHDVPVVPTSVPQWGYACRLIISQVARSAIFPRTLPEDKVGSFPRSTWECRWDALRPAAGAERLNCVPT